MPEGVDMRLATVDVVAARERFVADVVEFLERDQPRAMTARFPRGPLVDADVCWVQQLVVEEGELTLLWSGFPVLTAREELEARLEAAAGRSWSVLVVRTARNDRWIVFVPQAA